MERRRRRRRIGNLKTRIFSKSQNPFVEILWNLSKLKTEIVNLWPWFNIYCRYTVYFIVISKIAVVRVVRVGARRRWGGVTMGQIKLINLWTIRLSRHQGCELTSNNEVRQKNSLKWRSVWISRESTNKIQYQFTFGVKISSVVFYI